MQSLLQQQPGMAGASKAMSYLKKKNPGPAKKTINADQDKEVLRQAFVHVSGRTPTPNKSSSKSATGDLFKDEVQTPRQNYVGDKTQAGKKEAVPIKPRISAQNKDVHIHTELSYSGTISVTFHSARDLANMEWIGAMDPYAVLKIGTVQVKSDIHKKGGMNPVWEQTCSQALEGILLETTVEWAVLDKENLRSDDLCGTCSMAFTELNTLDKGGELHLTNEKSGKFAGVVNVTVTFDPPLVNKLSQFTSNGESKHSGAPNIRSPLGIAFASAASSSSSSSSSSGDSLQNGVLSGASSSSSSSSSSSYSSSSSSPSSSSSSASSSPPQSSLTAYASSNDEHGNEIVHGARPGTQPLNPNIHETAVPRSSYVPREEVEIDMEEVAQLTKSWKLIPLARFTQPEIHGRKIGIQSVSCEMSVRNCLNLMRQHNINSVLVKKPKATAAIASMKAVTGGIKKIGKGATKAIAGTSAEPSFHFKFEGLLCIPEILGFALSVVQEMLVFGRGYRAVFQAAQAFVNTPVKRLLGSRPKNWIEVSEEKTMFEVLLLMGQFEVTRLVVLHPRDGSLRNFISTTSVLRFLAERALKEEQLQNWANQTVEQFGLLNPKPLFPSKLHVMPYDSRPIDVFQLMNKTMALSVALVDEEGRLEGCLNARDICSLVDAAGSFRLVFAAMETLMSKLDEDRGNLFLSDPGAAEATDKKRYVAQGAFSCTPDTPLARVIKYLARPNIHAVFVVDSEQRPISVIHGSDVFRCIVQTPQGADFDLLEGFRPISAEALTEKLAGMLNPMQLLGTHLFTSNKSLGIRGPDDLVQFIIYDVFKRLGDKRVYSCPNKSQSDANSQTCKLDCSDEDEISIEKMHAL
eukprot:g14397.t1